MVELAPRDDLSWPETSQGLNLLTLVPSGWPWLKSYLSLRIPSDPALDAARRRIQPDSSPGIPTLLETLGFLHYGRWVLISKRPWCCGRRSFPKMARRQQRENAKYGLQVFMSNFNSDWRTYVEGFMDTAGDNLSAVWGRTPNWFGPSGGYERFFEQVNDKVVPHSHYYAAYPGIATADVKAALMVDREVRSFWADTRTMRDDEWEAEYQSLLTRVQRCLGTIDRHPAKGLDQGSRNVLPAAPPGIPESAYSRTGGVPNIELTVVCPLPLERLEQLRQYLLALPRGTGSPFARVRGTHFARFVVFDRVNCDANREWFLESGYLLFGADADGPLDEWLESVFESFGQDGIDAVWGDCYGFERNQDVEHFKRYIRKTSYRPTAPFSDYPYVSLWDVFRSLDTHAKFTAFAFDDTAVGNPETRRAALARICDALRPVEQSS